MTFNLWKLLIYIQVITNIYAFNYTNDDMLGVNSSCVTFIGTSGLCKRIYDCPKGKYKLAVEDVCYFERTIPVVCCDNSNMPESISSSTIQTLLIRNEISTNPTNSRFSNIRNNSVETTANENINKVTSEYTILKIRNKCYEYGQETDDSRKSTPKMVTIGWRSWDREVDWKCGGYIISENFVITAAHCTHDKGIPAEIVCINDINSLNDRDETTAQDFNITQIFVHPNYTRGQMYNDIALMKITTNSTFTSFIRPACLWTKTKIPKSDVTTIGFDGRTNKIFLVNMTLITNGNCRENLDANSKIPNGIVDNQICARDPTANVDTCQSVSGGPMILKRTNGEHVVGITSFGDSCDSSKPVIFTRVEPYLEWIFQIVWQNYTQI